MAARGRTNIKKRTSSAEEPDGGLTESGTHKEPKRAKTRFVAPLKAASQTDSQYDLYYFDTQKSNALEIEEESILYLLMHLNLSAGKAVIMKEYHQLLNSWKIHLKNMIRLYKMSVMSH